MGSTLLLDRLVGRLEALFKRVDLSAERLCQTVGQSESSANRCCHRVANQHCRTTSQSASLSRQPANQHHRSTRQSTLSAQQPISVLDFSANRHLYSSASQSASPASSPALRQPISITTPPANQRSPPPPPGCRRAARQPIRPLAALPPANHVSV